MSVNGSTSPALGAQPIHRPPSTGREVELKLLAAPADLARLAELPQVKAMAAGPAVRERQITTYFDTGSLDLARRGVALRVRRTPRGRIQALKTLAGSGDAAGVAVRREWEWAIDGDVPDLARLADPELAAILPADLLRDIRPVFTTDVQRTTLLLRPGALTEVELALDMGQIGAFPRDGATTHRPIAEVELELRGGRISDLFALAAELHRRVPLRLSVRSKADEGFALLTGELPVAATARPLGLSPATTVAEAFRHIGRNALDQLLRNESPMLTGSDPESLREMAAALRRLDVAFGLFKLVAASGRAQGLRHELRSLGGPVLEARAWARLADRTLAHDKADARLSQLVAGLRRSARLRAQSTVQSTAWAAWLLSFGAWLEGGDWAEGPVFQTRLAEIAPRLLDVRMAKVATAVDRLAERASGAARARLWRRLRSLRYSADFFRSLFPADRVRATLAAIDRVAGPLREMADAQEAMDLLAALDAPDELERSVGHLRSGLKVRRDRALKTTLKRWPDLSATPPFWA